MIMKQNDKLVCRIVNYIPSERTFEVEDSLTKTKGYVIFKRNYQDIPFLKEAYKKGETIPLFFDRYEEGKALFSYREIKVERRVEKAKVEINALFSLSDREFNISLFDALYSSLGSEIDTQEKYNLAKQLLSANKDLKVRNGLAKDIFRMCAPVYQTKLWVEGIIPYFSNFGIRKLWSDSNEEEKDVILQRLGISIDSQTNSDIQCLFEDIAQEIIKNILSATQSVKIAMAWFTNFDIFKVIKNKLETSNIEIILVTNNDLINNGGYCLNFDELIDAGLKIILYEYPEMINHKFCIIDNSLVMTGSYNWTFFAEAVNRENMLIIHDDKVVADYNREFERIVDGRPVIDKMPESVPERPEYDRSSFKQYVSEELVIRTRRHLGNSKENMLKANSLSPSYPSVIKALKEFNISSDNSGLSIDALESVASTNAIKERREQIQSHQLHLQELDSQRENLIAQQRVISNRQEEVQSQVQQIEENEDMSESEKNELQENIRKQQETLERQQEQLDTSLSQIEQESSNINQTVESVQEEINTIQETSQIETQGGRGTLKVNLKWNTTDDLDLHVIDPSGFEIYYSNKEHICDGVKGQLDIDANARSPYTRSPQENIFWEEGKNAPIGLYKVKVVLYKKRDIIDRIPFTVTVYPDRGEVKTIPGIIGEDTHCKEIIEFKYTENGISYL